MEDDEDEFGLPSIARARRMPKRTGTGFDYDTRKEVERDLNFLSISAPGRERSNSSDIAEERGPAYPTLKKSEGKILRPQYKEILRGKVITQYRKSKSL
jgi:TBC1 domain family member 2